MKTTFKIILTFTAITFVVSSIIASPVKIAQAQGAATNVPIGTDFDFNNIMAHMKDFVLDKAATLIAKQILHQMTVSVVNWINTGFQGSPTFITNPEGFFLDAADQVTGDFLSREGALSRLCSPFSIDIRLGLALNQTQSATSRYTCTLGKIIGNANGTIEGFTGGDFRQGGWPAFVSMTTVPQNNVYGSYLQAHSELLGRIDTRENQVNRDLDRGKGFLSRRNCTDIPGGTIDPENEFEVEQAESIVGNSRDMNRKQNNDGTVTYQTCTTDTPGSVISNMLQKQLDVPATELELADDINSVVNALISQMINQVIGGGLSGLSRGSSGGRTAYTSQLITDLNAQKAADTQSTNSQLSSVFDPAIAALNDYKSYYDQAIAAVTDSKNRYLTAKSCILSKVSDTQYSSSARTYAQNSWIPAIDTALTSKVDPLLADLTLKQASTSNQIAVIQNTRAQIASSGDIQSQLPGYQASVQIAINAKASAVAGISFAQSQLRDAQTKATAFNAEALQYQNNCAGFPGNTPTSGRQR
ncbi:MAG: hypothetical protein AAB365_03355 [Patescibacteria group bacterium]